MRPLLRVALIVLTVLSACLSPAEAAPPGALSTPRFFDAPFSFLPREGHTDAAPITASPPTASPGPGLRAAEPRLLTEGREGKTYLLPALEISAFVVALHGFSRIVLANKERNGHKIFNSDLSTFWNHLSHGPWVFDQDPFVSNQLGHPYQGSIYHGIARSMGLGYWESLGYTFAGSIAWEVAGEATPPSYNDHIMSGVGGTFFGEPLFRMANLLLEVPGKPPLWREVGAALLSPPTGFNRLVFGERFRSPFPSHDPAIFWRLRAGVTTDVRLTGKDSSERTALLGDLSVLYGLPGKPGYTYRRPFDYFQFEVTAVTRTADPLENITTRGLLVGQPYDVGETYRGVWGLYGSYDYLSPHAFRVSSTAVSLGTTGQWWCSPAVALQGWALTGIGYGAAANVMDSNERDVHYGGTAQGVLSARLILGDLAMIEAGTRAYYVSGLGTDQPRGNERIVRFGGGATVRVSGRHGVGLQYFASRRDGHSPSMGKRHQRVTSVCLMYNLLGDTGFGAVEWRDVLPGR